MPKSGIPVPIRSHSIARFLFPIRSPVETLNVSSPYHKCESTTSPLKQNFHIHHPQNMSRRTPTFLFSHKSWSTTSKIGHMHWSRIAPSASTKVMSPLEGPSPGLEALGTLEIHIYDLLSFSAVSIRSKRFLKCAFKDDPFTRASFADSLSTNAIAFLPLK